VQVVPLAYDVGDALDVGTEPGNSLSNTSVKILTVGHINPNKRVASVIKAIESSPSLRERCDYQVVGLIQDHVTHELASMARNADVRLRINGEVDSSTLARKFQSADIVCCLRWPSLESASASAIEAMMHGKAVVVTDTGFYGELPDDCVVKIDPADEVTSLRDALERLAFDTNFRQMLAARARIWSTKTFTARNYAHQLQGMGEMASRAAPSIAALRHFSDVLEGWGGGGIDMDEIVRPLQLFESKVSP
jgi:glycosyltransferase involved in cell wall biosynthesis